jgi:NitT/TauT family transport system substrate-binding protein
MVFAALERHDQPVEIPDAETAAATRISAMSAMCARCVSWRAFWRASRLAVAALAVAAALTSAGAAQTNLRFTLDRKYEGPSAPFLLPLDQGYYKAEGLNVSFDPATNMAEAIKRVASGDYEMGFADINAVIKYNDANPKTPVKAVFMVYNRPPFAVIARKSRGISTPKDLEGHKLGGPAGSGSFSLWPIFAKANGIDVSKVTVEKIGPQVRDPMLASGQIDAITGLSYSTAVDLKDKGVPPDDIVVMLMADYGVAVYGSAIIVNPAFAGAHPDAVKGFLRAYLRGLKKTIAAPASALEYVLERTDAGRKNLELDRLKIVIRENIVTPEVKANGFGGVDSERFARAIDQLAQSYTFKQKPKLNEVFDASFLPPESERKAD